MIAYVESLSREIQAQDVTGVERSSGRSPACFFNQMHPLCQRQWIRAKGDQLFGEPGPFPQPNSMMSGFARDKFCNSDITV